MSGNPESEQWQNFNERLSQWISSQGFWFQLRYSLSRGNSRGAFMFHFLKLASRLMVFLFVVITLWVVIVKNTGEERFVEDLSESLQSKFGAEELQIKGLEKKQGSFYISKLAMIGATDTFFSDLEISNLTCKRGFFDDFRSEWNLGVIEISKLEVSVHAGADSAAAANAMADVILQIPDHVTMDSIHVEDVSISWGYSARTRGSIDGSRMRARRMDDGWKLIFAGGNFSQNWLKDLDIVELVVEVKREGLRFEKAVFAKNKGSVVFEGLNIKSGQQPIATGRVLLQNIHISDLVPLVARDFIEGQIDGDLKVTGSTNSSQGVGFFGTISLEGKNYLTLRDQLPFLRALSVVDSLNSYRKVIFEDGSLRIRSGGGKLEVDEVEISAGQTMQLTGSMTVREPKADEALVDSDGDKFTRAIRAKDKVLNRMELSLRTAAGAGDESDVESKDDENQTLFSKLGISQDSRKIAIEAATELTRSYRYEGEFMVTLPNNAFKRSPQLQQIYPVSVDIDRIKMKVPIEGVLFDLTGALADEIYKNGGR